MITELLLAFVAIGIALYFLRGSGLPKNFPPGPRGLPILGNVLQLGSEPFQAFIQMRKQYGDIIGLRFGSQKGIVLNNYKHIREAFNDSTFSGRPCNDIIVERCGGKPRGIIFTDGKDWTEQRRFTLKSLRDFGFGKKSMEVLVLEEVKDLIETFKKLDGKPFSTQNKFNAAVLNALWTLVTGKRHAQDDPVLLDLIHRLTSGIQTRGRFTQVVIFFPSLARLPFLRKNLQKFRETRLETMKFLEDAIEAHKDSFQENSARDFIDLYFEEMNRTTDPHSSFFKGEGEKQLLLTMLDLFIAGAETTSTTLTWTFLLLAVNMKEQEELFREIMVVVGDSRLPSLADRPSMPFTEATIMEVMRYSAMVPLGVNHKTVADINFHGYTIPAETIVFPNLYCAMHDPLVWGDPEVFRPRRFLSKDGRTVIRHDAFLPFSTGKRVCLGETLARDELFLFTTCLFQRFIVSPDPEDKGITAKGYIPSFVLFPKPHQLILTDRQNNKN